MAPANHAFLSWWTANVLPLTYRDRLVVFLAGVLPDLDGLTLFISRDAYLTYHHVIAHNLLAGLVWVGFVAASTSRRLVCATLALLNWHLHLACDYFGSAGPQDSIWVLPYFFPFLGGWDADGEFVGPEWYWNPWQWELSAWPNILVMVLGLIGFVYIAVRLDRTWFEFVWPRMDRELCATFRRRFGGTPVEAWSAREARRIRQSFVAITTVALLACVVAAARVSAR